MSSIAMMATLLVGSAHAATASGPRLYKYTDQNSDETWPSMVFESKGKTYFKLARNAKTPSVVAITNCHAQAPVQSKQIDGYLMVPEMHTTYLLTIGDKQRVVYYPGTNKFTAAEAPADNLTCESKSVSASTTTAAAPAGSLPTATPAKPASDTSAKPAPLSPPKKQYFSIKTSDGTLYGTVSRWAKEAGWQVSWEAVKDFDTKFEATYEGDFESSVEQLMKSMERSEYPLRACAFDNKVIRIIHKSKSCES
jgi:hypothetical protein